MQSRPSQRRHFVPKPESEEQLITSENVTVEILQSFFEAAFLEHSLDSDGDIILSEGVRCFLSLRADKLALQLTVFFFFKPDCALADRLAAVNAINFNYNSCKAIAHPERNDLIFVHEVSLRWGITPKALVQTIRSFCSIPREAIRDHANLLID